MPITHTPTDVRRVVEYIPDRKRSAGIATKIEGSDPPMIRATADSKITDTPPGQNKDT